MRSAGRHGQTDGIPAYAAGRTGTLWSMLHIRGIAVAVIGASLLVVGVVLVLPGIVRGPQHTAAVLESPGSYVLGTPITRPPQPVGFSAHVAHQPDPSNYIGLMQADGATSVRDDLQWAFVEPVQGEFNWSVPDEIVTLSAEHHMHALLIVDTTPEWANGASKSNKNWYWVPPSNPATYGVFAATVAARYGPGGAFWKENPSVPRYMLAGLELWNEENINMFWGGRTPNPQVYAGMLIAAYSRIKQADPAMTVLVGGLAPEGAYDDITCSGTTSPSGGHNAQRWNGLNYLQALYADGIHGHFDAIAWHSYTFWGETTAAEMMQYNICSSWSQLASTPLSVRSLMVAHGDGNKRVWMTETGVPTCIANATYDCVVLAQQADLATDELRQWQSWSWSGGFYWYELRDEKGANGTQAHYGALYSNNSPKPAYKALHLAWN